MGVVKKVARQVVIDLGFTIQVEDAREHSCSFSHCCVHAQLFVQLACYACIYACLLACATIHLPFTSILLCVPKVKLNPKIKSVCTSKIPLSISGENELIDHPPQGNSEDMLPEVLLGSVRMHKVSDMRVTIVTVEL